MQPEPKKHVSHWIAWSIIALSVGLLGFFGWRYYDEINTIYDNLKVASVQTDNKSGESIPLSSVPDKKTPNVVASALKVEPSVTDKNEAALAPNISFSFLPEKGNFPHPITVKLNDLGHSFYQNETKEIWTLGDGDKSFISFDGGTYWSNYDKAPSLDRYIEDNKNGYMCIGTAYKGCKPNGKLDCGCDDNKLSEVTKFKVGGLDAAKFTVTNGSKLKMLIINVAIFDDAEKPLQIGVNLNNISEADADKIIQSIVIDK